MTLVAIYNYIPRSGVNIEPTSGLIVPLRHRRSEDNPVSGIYAEFRSLSAGQYTGCLSVRVLLRSVSSFGIGCLDQGQTDPDTGPFAHLARDPDRPAMLSCDAVNDGKSKAQAPPFQLRRVEGLENPQERGPIHAVP